jgi:HSP20 family protein
MKSLIRRSEGWNPFREMEELQNRLSSLIEGFGTRLPQQEGEGIAMGDWAPLVDITEDEKEYLVKVELPEVRKEDLKVTVENGVLSISGERKLEKEEKGKRYHRIERAYGSFTRSFTLPEGADSSKVNAQFKDGVLQVHLAKSETARPKAIDVKIS